jgi:hypothetical protein
MHPFVEYTKNHIPWPAKHATTPPQTQSPQTTNSQDPQIIYTFQSKGKTMNAEYCVQIGNSVEM